MRVVVASAAEAELRALFHNCQTGMIFQKNLKDLGRTQPKMPVHCDNATEVGIASNIVKRQRSRLMEMQFSGWETRWHKRCTISPGTWEWNIWQTTRANITYGCITWQLDHIICTKKNHQEYYQEQQDLAL